MDNLEKEVRLNCDVRERPYGYDATFLSIRTQILATKENYEILVEKIKDRFKKEGVSFD